MLKAPLLKPANAEPFLPAHFTLPLLRCAVQDGRGILLHRDHLPALMATVHPSSVLRARSEDDRHREMNGFIVDLKKAKECLNTAAGK